MLATEGMNAVKKQSAPVPVLDALIRIVSYESRAVDGGLICSDISQTFAERSPRFLIYLVVMHSKGNFVFTFIIGACAV
jgi:hypothetical protein